MTAAGMLQVGARVTAEVYGRKRIGVVLAHRTYSVVWVHWTDAIAPVGIVTWMHRESLSVVGGAA